MSRAHKISVVIPCYNAKRYIASALRSVFAQEGCDFEVIVVDDGSTDGSAELIEVDFPSVKILRQLNGGAASARNSGIRHATGNWIAFLDADDIWLRGKLRAQLALLDAHPSSRMAYSAWRVWESNEPAPNDLEMCIDIAGNSSNWEGPSGWIYPELLSDCEVWTSTVVAARTLFDEIGDFDCGLRIGEDYDFWLRSSRVTPILRVQRPLALYRQHPTSITRSAPVQNYHGIVVSRALAKWGYAHEERSVRADPVKVNRALAKSWSDFAQSSLKAGKLANARRGALCSLRVDFGHVPGWKTLVKTAFKAVGSTKGSNP